MLGEVFDPASNPDASYSGDTSGTLVYVRNKIREFQGSLNALDSSAQAMRQLMAINGIDEDTFADAQVWLDDYEANRVRAVATAETINAAVEGANALGVRMPVLSIPQGLQGLGFPPAAVAAIAAAIAAGAWALSYAASKIAEATAIAQRARANAQMLESLPPEQRAAALSQIAEVERTLAVADTERSPATTIANVASIVKWLAIGAAAFFAFKAFNEYRSG